MGHYFPAFPMGRSPHRWPLFWKNYPLWRFLSPHLCHKCLFPNHYHPLFFVMRTSIFVCHFYFLPFFRCFVYLMIQIYTQLIYMYIYKTNKIYERILWRVHKFDNVWSDNLKVSTEKPTKKRKNLINKGFWNRSWNLQVLSLRLSENPLKLWFLSKINGFKGFFMFRKP